MKVYVVKTAEGNQGVFQSRANAEKECRRWLEHGAEKCHMFDDKCTVVLLYNTEAHKEMRFSDVPMNIVPCLELKNIEEVSVMVNRCSGKWNTVAIETWELGY